MADFKLIGRSFGPPDLEAKITGRAKFSEDFRAEGMLFAKLLVSPMPHCRVTRIDASDALAMPGVEAILTADDLPEGRGMPNDERALTMEPLYEGEPILAVAEIPTTLKGDPVVGAELNVAGKTLSVTCVSMGNPHCITYVDELSDAWVLGVGPRIETDPHFPARVNAEFVQIISPDEVRLRVWERGSGETLACGTGASAVCVAGVLSGKTARKILAHLPGGDLELEWSEEDNHVYLTGPAVEVFSGEWEMQPEDNDKPFASAGGDRPL